MNMVLTNFLVLAQMQAVEAENAWSDTLQGIDPEKRFVLIMVALGCAVGVILGLAGMIIGAMNTSQRRRMEMEMKRDMIERGMSAEEIERVIECTAPPDDATDRWIASWCKRKEKSKAG
jgi:hypothetical protein